MKAERRTIGSVALGRQFVQRICGSLALSMIMGSAYSQDGTVNGRVVDQQGEPVAFASVAIDGVPQNAASNGAFRIPTGTSAERRVRVTSVGYSTWEGAYRADTMRTELVVVLEERVAGLSDVSIQRTLTGGSGPSKRTPGSAWYISPREIRQFAYTDVNRLLRSVPGVHVQEEDGYGLRPNIGMRGAGSERSSKITVMEDGLLMAPAPYASPAAYYFPTVGRMHAIELVKGSSQVRTGPLTTGGAINLLSTPIPTTTAGAVRVWGGSYGARNLHAHAGTTTVGRVGVLVETFRQGADGFKVLDNGDPTGFTKEDLLGKLEWSSAPGRKLTHTISLKAGQVREESHETYLGLTLSDLGRDPYRRYAGSAKDRMRVLQDQASAIYTVRFPSGAALAATVYRTNTARSWYKLDNVKDSTGVAVGISALLKDPAAHPHAFDIIRGSASADNALQVRSNDRNYQSSGAQLVFTRTVEGPRYKQALEVGMRVHTDYMDRFQWNDGYRMVDGEMRLTSSGTPGTESNRIAEASAVAGHAAYSISKGRFSLHPGMRVEHIEMGQDDYGKQDVGRTGSALKRTRNTVDVLIPGIGIEWRTREWAQVFAGVHKGFSPPGTEAGARPESSINSELGIRINKSGVELQLIGFHTAYQEMLGADLAAAGGTGTGDLFNAGSALVVGLECFLRKDLLHGSSTRFRAPFTVSYTLTDARFGNTFQSSFEPWGNVVSGDRIPYIPVHQLNVRASLEGRRGSVSAGMNHVGSMASVTGVSADADDQRIPANTVLDMAASYRLDERIELFAAAQNVLGTVYAVSALPAGWRPGLPRSVQVGVRATF